MSNLTDTASKFTSIPRGYVLYITQGGLLALSNLLIVSAILRNKHLRRKKGHIIVAGLSLADTLAGLGYHTAGIYRSYLILTGQRNLKVSTWECMHKVHVWFFHFGAPLSALMLACVSIDRLLAVWIPIRYFKFTYKYAYKLVGAFYTFSFIGSCSFVVASYLHPRDQLIRLTCGGDDTIGQPILKRYYFLVRVLSGLVSVVLYLFIPFLYGFSMKKLTPENAARLSKQKRLMVTLGISACFTFVCFVLPNAVRTFLVNDIDHNEMFAVYKGFYENAATLQNLNPLFNVALYLLRHKDIRVAVGRFLVGKAAPVAPA